MSIRDKVIDCMAEELDQRVILKCLMAGNPIPEERRAAIRVMVEDLFRQNPEIAVVDREAELPENPNSEKALYMRDGVASPFLYINEYKAYEEAQQDMKGWVKEVGE